MFIERTLAVEVTPLFDDRKGILNNPLPVSLGSGILLFLDRIRQ
jgi:hypothetical protein